MPPNDPQVLRGAAVQPPDEAGITRLVHAFYDRARRDRLLGPVFEAAVHDWDQHLDTLVRFWCSVLLRAGSYRGNPMLLHRALPGLTRSMFERWLDLFHEAASALPNRAMAERAGELSQRIAQSLWYDYQLQSKPDRMPASLPRRAAARRSAAVPD